MASTAIPAAQYLRMSTEHQRYSMDNQADAIKRYAESRGFSIIKTYSDAGRSGLRLENRPALQQLLKDVIAGGQEYRAILVYDVSRWGRFQDVDEAAHYEFICRNQGTPIYYCAESFPDDETPSSVIMKLLKRVMAAEYSRELGVKVYEGQKKLWSLGFCMGQVPRYGLRRLLVSSDREPKRLLSRGERKTFVLDRIRRRSRNLHNRDEGCAPDICPASLKEAVLRGKCCGGRFERQHKTREG